jgi:predicted acylesterase/phospholipase RssA
METVRRIYLDLSPEATRLLQEKCKELLFHPTGKPHEYLLSPLSYKKLGELKLSHKVLKVFPVDDLPVELVYPFESTLFEIPQADAILEAKTYAMAKQKGKGGSKLLYWSRSAKKPLGSFRLDRPGGQRSYHWSLAKNTKGIVRLEDKFPKLMARIRDPDTKVILSLGSGGVRLFAHAALLKFIDLLNLTSYVKEVWGSSGGAVAGLMYSLGVDPGTIETEGYNLYNNRYSLRFSPSKYEVLVNLFADTFFPAGDHLLNGFLDCQKALRFMISRHMTKKPKRKIPFYSIAYNLKDKRNEILTPEKVPKNVYITPTYQVDALDAVIASSSIPILYVPKKILRGKSEHIYVDGGTTEEVPLISPYRKWIRDRLNSRDKSKKLLIIAVNLFPAVSGIPLLNLWWMQKMPAFRLLKLSASYADLIRQARIDEQKGHLQRDKDVTLWELVLPLKGMNVLNPRTIPEIIQTAQSSFMEQLLAIEDSLD